jgi:hypothetical protein
MLVFVKVSVNLNDCSGRNPITVSKAQNLRYAGHPKGVGIGLFGHGTSRSGAMVFFDERGENQAREANVFPNALREI